MKCYILSSQKDTFAHKIELASKHLSRKPEVVFSEPMMKRRTTYTIINNGWDGRYREVDYIEVIEVTIEDIQDKGWTLVANVHHREGVVELVDGALFGKIPSSLGLGYSRCDYCGGKHSGRILSHILFNSEKGEWKQVGSTCISKMFGNRYITKFTTDLVRIVEICFGCLDDDCMGIFGRKETSHFMGQAICVADILTAVREYRKENPVWKKKDYTPSGAVIKGTTDLLNEWLCLNVIEPDTEYVTKVTEYAKNLPESDFNNGMKEAIENGFIARHEIYKVFFLCKAYDDDHSGLKERMGAFMAGQPIVLEGVKMTSSEWVEDMYGRSLVCVFEKDGIRFTKGVANSGVIEKFHNEADDTYSFSATVKWVYTNRGIISLGGRLRKI